MNNNKIIIIKNNIGNSSGPSIYANSENYNYFSGEVKAFFDGFINENYISIFSQEKNLIQNMEIAHALITKNPITYQKDAFISLILKSKCDFIGNRQSIDILPLIYLVQAKYRCKRC